MLEIKNLKVIFNENTVNEKIALDSINLTINDGDFITVIGSNGAGKSTLLNSIAGSIEVYEGRIMNNGKDITYMKEHRRARFIGRLFQDPLKGTAPHMTIEENLGLAYSRGKSIRFGFGVRKKDHKLFKQACEQLGLGLENRLKSEVGLLSGGQRQALTLLMATLKTPELLLLDEHTAALDPKTSRQILEITKNIVEKDKITTLMITHNIQNAMEYGNKTLVMAGGSIIKVLEGDERKGMTIQDIMKLYAATDEMLSDRSLLS
ncbi:ABC transporter ATP-binding protein [Johnsonella ignava]|uniref:ABC transporter ATP-binding protein n=1 Tax=Johnsonella ignava TaxID=43995 RepID=UPI0023F0699E|nr:ATP-binding cassette domain-containing protein [Johnsonella ignava]